MPDPVKENATAPVPAPAAAVKEKAPLTASLYQKLRKEEAELEAKLAPAREVYDRKINDPELRGAMKTIREVSAKLAGVKNELAALVRPAAKASIRVESGVYSKK